MNIGFVVHHYDPSDGTGGYAVNLVTRLARDHEVTLYAAAVRVAPPQGVTVVSVPALGGTAYARILSFPAAFAMVRRKHDIVHAQGWVTGKADVVTAHIVLGAWREAARRAGVRSRAGERLLGGFVAGREWRLVQRATRVIAPSHRAAADITTCYGRTEGVTVVHHGFPAPAGLPERAPCRARFGVPANAFVALFAGDARKGVDVAITAVAATPGVHLLVASRSPADRYLDLARSLGVSDRVHWPGAAEDIRTAFAAADVLLHPTIYDTFALVAAEAMAWGIPAIVSPQAGIADLIRHMENGWVLGPGQSDAAAALARFRYDTVLRSRIAAAARQTAATRSWGRVVHETIAVYEAARR